MKREEAKDYAKTQFRRYLQDKGIDTSQPFVCPHCRNDAMSFYDGTRVHCFYCNLDGDIFDYVAAECGIGEDEHSKKFKKVYGLLNIHITGGKNNG